MPKLTRKTSLVLGLGAWAIGTRLVFQAYEGRKTPWIARVLIPGS